MLLHGREVKFFKSVKSACKIGEICPQHDINKVGELFKNVQTTTEELTTMCYFMVCLSEGYEDMMQYEAVNSGKEYEGKPLTMDELMICSEDEINTMFAEAVEAFFGNKITVEAEPPKKKAKAKTVKSD